ncbi:MAG: ABC transporter permease [Candidatus Hydrogenedentota bacterium]
MAICSRNFRVLRRMIVSAVLAHIGEPVFFLVIFGYGLSQFIDNIEGRSFAAWLLPGIAVTSAMTSASLECTYSAFTRMDRQKTYLAIASTPVSIEEVVVGEALWGMFMGFLTASFCLSVNFFLSDPWTLAAMARILCAATLGALVSSSLGLFFTSWARGYEDFAMYFTLILTPMSALSGAYFPITGFPEGIRGLAMLVPSTHAVLAARSSVTIGWPHAVICLMFALPLLYLAIRGVTRRVIP